MVSIKIDELKKMKVTYGELHHAMENLGFTRKLEKSRDEVKERLLGKPRFFIGYIDKNGKLFYPLIQRSDNAEVLLKDLFHISRELCEFGFTNDYDDLAKLIEKNREAAQKAAA